MPDWDKLTKNLEKHGFAVSRFADAQAAADYIDGKVDGKTVGSGGSVTLKEMGLLERLAGHNRVVPHVSGGALPESMTVQVFLSSVNGLAETGEIVNIDGTCNRVCNTMFGHEEVYLIVGRNKIAPDYAGALWRARNIAGPKNAQRLGRKTPCAVKADRCYDCNSPERICRSLVTLWRKSTGVGRVEVVLVDQDLGY